MSTGTANDPVRRKRMTAEARREVIELAATDVFAERGYHGASIDEIAKRSGVTAPVVYDHFNSKKELHLRLIERHYAELRAVWGGFFPGSKPLEERMARAFDAWFAYVQGHPYALRMLFRDTTGDPDLRAAHHEIEAESREALLPLLAGELDAASASGPADVETLEMTWEALRGALQAIALWWAEHPRTPRSRVVATAMQAVWIGLDGVGRGERWHQ